MEFFKLIRNQSSDFSRGMFLTTALAGVLNMGIAMIVIIASQELAAEKIDFPNLLMFFAAVVGFYFCKRHSFISLSKGIEKELDRMRLRIAIKIRHANLATFEKIGKSMFNTVLNRDTSIIAQNSPHIINACGSFVMLIMGSILILTQSLIAFLIAAAVIAGCIAFYFAQRKQLNKHLEASTRYEGEFFGGLTDLLESFKQIKLNAERDQAFYEQCLSRLSACVVRSKIDTSKTLVNTVVVGQLFMFLLMGAVVFVLPAVSPDEIDTIPVVVALLLFIAGPIGEIVAVVQLLDPTNHSIRNIKSLEDELDDLNNRYEEVVPTKSAELHIPKTESIRCEQCEFSYARSKEYDGFSIGPINFELKRGELIYVIGGNGSGKSTFLKMLTGLYLPDKGQLYMDDKPVSGNKYFQYRNLFTPIFTDFHILDRLYGLDNLDQEKVNELLSIMELDQVTSIQDGHISNRNLSTGQRKRLAMIISLLEDRPFCVYDEVAADQDPHFRKYYYETFLQDLKRQNKAVFCITHDDTYFHTADRILKMEFGKLGEYQG